MKIRVWLLIISLLALCNLSMMMPADFGGGVLTGYEQDVKNIHNMILLQGRGEAEITRIVTWIGKYNRVMSMSMKQTIAREIWDMSLRYDNLSVDLICATITWESALTWRPSVVSPVGAIGLMQIMPATGAVIARWKGVNNLSIIDLFDPILNIQFGCRYLSYLIGLYNCTERGLANYNGGPYQAKYYVTGDIRLCDETRYYVPNVLLLAEKFGAK